MISSRDVRERIAAASDVVDAEYDLHQIVEEVIERHGAVDIDAVGHAAFWAIAHKYEVRSAH